MAEIDYTLAEVVRRLDGISQQISGLVSTQVYDLQVTELKENDKRLEARMDAHDEQRREDRRALTNNRWLMMAGVIAVLIPYIITLLSAHG